MQEIVTRARERGGVDLVLVAMNHHALEALDQAITEKIVRRVFVVDYVDVVKKDPPLLPPYEVVEVKRDETHDGDDPLARAGVAVVRDNPGTMLMKGRLNTVPLMRAVLDKERGIATERRLSLTSIFKIPSVPDRFVLLSDGAINPLLTEEGGIANSIIENAVMVAKKLGVPAPKVAILGANEDPSPRIPSSLVARRLSECSWSPGTVVSGPLSYDLALSPESARIKGVCGHPVAGKADILIAPEITTANVLYKALTVTMGLDVASVVMGARAPIILTSRNDRPRCKFLAICASALLVERQ